MKWRILALSALLVVVTAMLGRQRQQGSLLRAELETAQQHEEELIQLRAEKERLLRTQVSAAELEQLRADHRALERLRDEVKSMTQRKPPQSERNGSATDANNGLVKSSSNVMNEIVPVGELRNAGRGSAAAAVQTALWAATGGEIDVLADTILIDPLLRGKAEQMLAAVPESLRIEYRTPERLIALLTTKDVPLGGARIIDIKRHDPAGDRFVAQLQETNGKTRNVALTVRQTANGWKLVLPASALEKYRQMLTGVPLAGTRQ